MSPQKEFKAAFRVLGALALSLFVYLQGDVLGFDLFQRSALSLMVFIIALLGLIYRELVIK